MGIVGLKRQGKLYIFARTEFTNMLLSKIFYKGFVLSVIANTIYFMLRTLS